MEGIPNKLCTGYVNGRSLLPSAFATRISFIVLSNSLAIASPVSLSSSSSLYYLYHSAFLIFTLSLSPSTISLSPVHLLSPRPHFPAALLHRSHQSHLSKPLLLILCLHVLHAFQNHSPSSSSPSSSLALSFALVHKCLLPSTLSITHRSSSNAC